MADNTLLNSGAGGDTIRDKDRAGVKTQIVAIDLNPAGAETLMAGVMPTSAPTPTFWSSTEALGVGQSVHSTSFDVSNGQLWIGYSAVSVTPLAVQFLESADNVNFVATDSYTVAANTTGNYSYHKSSGRYSYLIFTNLGAANAGGIGNIALFVSQSAYASESDIGVAGIANAANPLALENSAQALSLDLSAKLRTRDDNILAYSQTTQSETLAAILKEVRVTNELLKQGLNVHDELDSIRADIDSILTTSQIQ